MKKRITKATVNPKYKIQYDNILSYSERFKILETSLERDIDECFKNLKYPDEIEIVAEINGKRITATGFYQKSVSDIIKEQERGECVLYFDTYHFYDDKKYCYYFTATIKLAALTA